MDENKKSKILGIASLIISIIGWILYEKIGIIFCIIIEIIALALSIIAKKNKNIKNRIAIAGEIISIILLCMMIVVFIGSGIFLNVGNDAIINKSKQIQMN